MSSTTMQADVVIVGARAAGAATAMLLARAGLDTIVVDRSRYGADTLSTHALMRAGVVQLHRWGLLARIVDSGAPAIGQATFHHGQRKWQVEMRPSSVVDRLYAPRRTVLDPVLVDAAVAAGARVRHGITIGGVTRDRSGRVTGVVGHDTQRRQVSIGARLVVGADGLRSIVASEVGAAVERRGRSAGAYVYGYWTGVEAWGYEWAFGPGATAGLIPTNDGLVCVFAGSHGGGPSRDLVSDYVRLLRRSSNDLAERVLAGHPSGRLRRFAGPPGVHRRACGAGWALVGDAGSWTDPISAHGLSAALRDAELLARAIVTAFSGLGCDEAEALRSYEERRDRLSADLFWLTDTMASGAWTDDSIDALLRAVSVSMAAEVEELEALGPWPARTSVATSSEVSTCG